MNNNNDNTLAGNNAEEIKKRYVQRKQQASVQRQLINDYNYLRSKEDSQDGVYNICHTVMSQQGRAGLQNLIRVAGAMLAHADNGATL